LFVLSGILFGYAVPRAQKAIFAHVTTDLPPKVLDVHFMTWTPPIYWSLLALVFPQGSRFAWLVPLGLLGWVFDTAENITHFRMARSYPHLSSFALKFGPQFTYWKWMLAIVTPLVAVAGFAARLF
jgi:hypothetical protein